MFDGDNDGSGAKLTWVYVFGHCLHIKIKTVNMKEKKMKKKN